MEQPLHMKASCDMSGGSFLNKQLLGVCLDGGARCALPSQILLTLISCSRGRLLLQNVRTNFHTPIFLPRCTTEDVWKFEANQLAKDSSCPNVEELTQAPCAAEN